MEAEKIQTKLSTGAYEIVNIPLEHLEADPQNIREEPKIDDDFRESIRKGIIQPLIVRPVSSIEDEKARKELESKGKRYAVVAGVRRFEAAVQAGLETVPCMVREMSDLEAIVLSMAENRHRRDIPAWKWCEVIGKLYDRLEGSKDQRVRRIKELTGMGEGTIYGYLLLKDIPAAYKVRLKEPSERSFSEKKLLADTSAPRSEEKPLLAEKGGEAILSELSRVPEEVMVRLFRDKDFRLLSEKDPVKTHELLTKAAQLGRDRLGQILHQVRLLIRPRKKAGKSAYPAPIPPVEIAVRITFTEDMFRALDLYREEGKFATYTEAVSSILLSWIRRERSVEYVDLQAAFEDIVNEFLVKKKYLKKTEEAAAPAS